MGGWRDVWTHGYIIYPHFISMIIEDGWIKKRFDEWMDGVNSKLDALRDGQIHAWGGGDGVTDR